MYNYVLGFFWIYQSLLFKNTIIPTINSITIFTYNVVPEQIIEEIAKIIKARFFLNICSYCNEILLFPYTTYWGSISIIIWSHIWDDIAIIIASAILELFIFVRKFNNSFFKMLLKLVLWLLNLVLFILLFKLFIQLLIWLRLFRITKHYYDSMSIEKYIFAENLQR